MDFNRLGVLYRRMIMSTRDIIYMLVYYLETKHGVSDKFIHYDLDILVKTCVH